MKKTEAKRTPTKLDFIRRARLAYAQDGEIEIDDNARISESAEGAYVSAWVWVPSV